MIDNEITVLVVEYPDRKNLMMRYKEPATGKHIARSTGTNKRREAERIAAKWEAELRDGRYSSPSKIGWDEFRERYEREVLPSLADGTDRKVKGVFNKVEEILRPAKLRDLTAERLSRYQSVLRSQGRAEDTIAGHLAHLRSALQWSVRIGMLSQLPLITKPRRAKGASAMKGRPLTKIEFEQMLTKVPDVVGVPAAESWKHYLEGLRLSGLRLGESMELSWNELGKLCIDLSQEFPMLRIPAELEKGHKDRLLPIVPEFAEFLLATPEEDRNGYVFNPLSKDGRVRLKQDRVMRRTCEIGKKANVKVSSDPTGKKLKYASAQDLRRTYGFYWASKVMPPVLQELMRHESIETTLRYYVGRNAQATAKLLWDLHGKK